MYVNIPVNHKCSKCGGINTDRTYWENANNFRECKNCGHKKIVARITTTNSSGIIYNAKTIDEPIEY